MNEIMEHKSAKETFQPFDMMRTHFCAMGFQIATRLGKLRDDLMTAIVKRNRRTIQANELFAIREEIDQLITSLSTFYDLELFRNIYNRLIEISMIVTNGQIQRALGVLLPILNSPLGQEALNGNSSMHLLEEPPVLIC